MVVTLIPKDIAYIGYEFNFIGGIETCAKCPLKKVCIDSLAEGHKYRVIDIRKKEHKCLIDGSIMVVCDVEETSYIISVEKQKFLEGIIIKREPIECGEIFCAFYENCKNVVFDKEIKVKVIKQLKEIKCPLNYNLVLVEAVLAE